MIRNYLKYSIFVSVICVIYSQLLAKHEGEVCKEEGSWTCEKLSSCPQIGDFKTNRPPICGFNGREPIICCPPSTSTRKQAMTKLESNGEALNQCFRYDISLCSTGHSNFMKREIVRVVVNGTKAKPKDHPYMVLVGYGPENQKEWLCGGTLISKRYVLSAAHCSYSYRLGAPKWARLGELNLKALTESRATDFEIIEVINHPLYNDSLVYHDIALYKLEFDILFNDWVKPACLQTETYIPFETATAIGYGRIETAGPTSDHLMQVDLSLVKIDVCKKLIDKNKSAKLPQGIDTDTQLCAGEMEGGKDTCTGDSGGPLLVKPPSACLRTVVGITSFGRMCALANNPGVYTRVSYYIPWIESVVWPL